MRNIDRLIIKAKHRAKETEYRLIVAWIEYSSEKHKFISSCQLWNGVQGGIKAIAQERDTGDAAKAYVEKIAEEYPNTRDEVIVFYELVEEGG